MPYKCLRQCSNHIFNESYTKNWRPRSEKSERKFSTQQSELNVMLSTEYFCVCVCLSLSISLFSFRRTSTWNNTHSVTEIISICLNIKSKCMHNKVPLDEWKWMMEWTLCKLFCCGKCHVERENDGSWKSKRLDGARSFEAKNRVVISTYQHEQC